MSSRARVTLILLVVAVLALAAGVGLDQLRDWAMVAEVDEAVERIREEGMRKHPDVPEAEAMRREAAATVKERLAAEDDPVKRRVMAAGNFFGVYLLNTRQRPAYCRERGVDIAPFVAAYEEANAEGLKAARSALAASEVSEDRLRELLKPQLDELIARDMEAVAEAHGVTPAEACAAIAENAAAVASQLHVSKLQPEAHRVLTEQAGASGEKTHQ